MDESELLRKAKMQDDDAFNQLVNYYKPYIHALSRRYFIIGADDEDVYQEALIGFFRAVRTYKEDSKASFKTFATMCMNSQIQTKINKSHNEKNKPLNEAIDVDEGGEDLEGWAYVFMTDELTPEEQLINEQKIKLIVDYIKNGFNEMQRKVLNAYLYNYSYAQIAKMVGKESKFVDNCLTQMKKKLAKIVKREDL